MAHADATPVGHENIVELLQDCDAFAVHCKATGERRWLPEGPSWALACAGPWAYAHADGHASLG
eukprot:6792558-Alexandrium_andersonii.AAC.1